MTSWLWVVSSRLKVARQKKRLDIHSRSNFQFLFFRNDSIVVYATAHFTDAAIITISRFFGVKKF